VASFWDKTSRTSNRFAPSAGRDNLRQSGYIDPETLRK